jgi:transposase
LNKKVLKSSWSILAALNTRRAEKAMCVVDCQWIQQLHTYCLLQGAFRPEDQISVLPSHHCQRTMFVNHASNHIQHIQKALEQMNLKLTKVISDITGLTGMKIIQNILAGERNSKN